MVNVHNNRMIKCDVCGRLMGGGSSFIAMHADSDKHQCEQCKDEYDKNKQQYEEE